MEYGYHIYFDDFEDEYLVMEPMNTVFKIVHNNMRQIEVISPSEYFAGMNNYTIKKIEVIPRQDIKKDNRFAIWRNQKKMAINATMNYLYNSVIKEDFLDVPVPPNSRSVFYMFHDGVPKDIQSYNYFWDDDPKFQKVFRDDMGGNHQWLLMWANAGGRSGYADIVEFWIPNLLLPILNYFMNQSERKGLMKLLQTVRKRSISEFDKRSNYLMERFEYHRDNGEEEEENAFNSAMEDLKKATKRKDPKVYYQEYENMGFNHPRPDYRDEKYM